jgi:hypothetical protein
VSRGHETVTERSCEDSGFICEVLTDVEDFVCYNYSNLQSVISKCSCDL